MSLDSVIALGRSLDISLDWLLLGRGDMEPRPPAVAVDNSTLKLQALAERLRPETVDLMVALVESIRQEGRGRA